jgi:transposase
MICPFDDLLKLQKRSSTYEFGLKTRTADRTNGGPRYPLIAPHHKNRTRPAPQDGRAFRRYRRRWIVERPIGWLGNYRRWAVRYHRSLTIYQGFFHMACFMIVLRRVLQ